MKQEEICQGCGICIGPGYIERQTYRIGGYEICGWCLQEIRRRGELWVEPYSKHLFLQPDGEVSEEWVFASDEEK